MALEIVRKIVNGKWTTVAEEESAGGGSLTVTGDSGSVASVTTLDLIGSTVTESAPGVAEATVAVPVLSTRVELTDAQIKALPSAPLLLVAAPGAGKIIVPVSVLIRADTAADEYDNINGNASIAAGPQVAQFLVSILSEASIAGGKVSDLLTSFDNAFALMVPIFNTSTAAFVAPVLSVSDYENAGLSLFVDNFGAGNFTGGNAANSGSVTTLYMIVDL